MFKQTQVSHIKNSEDTISSLLYFLFQLPTAFSFPDLSLQNF